MLNREGPRLLMLALILVTSVSHALAQGTSPVSFSEDALLLGIDHVWGLEWFSGNLGGGVAIEDFDGDGDNDLVLARRAGASLAFFRNDGVSFTDISASSGVGDVGDVKQVLLADFDDDGLRDLLITTWRAPAWRLYRNLGGGVFAIVTGDGGVLPQPSTGQPTGACVGDYDGDGLLDVHLSMWRLGAPSPESANLLLRNTGGFIFENVTSSAGVADEGKSYQSVFADLDGDGWLDLVVANDKGGGITHFQNDRSGGFSDVTSTSGLDGFVASDGSFVDGMGVTVGDYDNDLDLDLYVTNINNGHVMYRNRGDGSFDEVAQTAGTIGLDYAWGTTFLDVDNDGWLDLYVSVFGTGSFPAENRLYLNDGSGGFEDVAASAGCDGSDVCFGTAAADLDGDGYPEIVVSNGAAKTRVYVNGAASNHWLRLLLTGVTSNRDGIGAKISVTAAGSSRLHEVRAGSSYLSHNGVTPIFGTGAATSIDEVEIVWPSGQVDRHANLAADRSYRVREGDAAARYASVLEFQAQARDDGRVDLSWRVDGEALLLERVDAGVAESILIGVEDTGTLVDDPGADGVYSYRLSEAGEIYAELNVTAATRFTSVALRAVGPNPFGGELQLELALPAALAAERVAVEVYDLRGRKVRVLSVDPTAGELLPLQWDGFDDAGRPAASGVYHVQARVGTVTRRIAVTLLR